jgi:hypothetical protein
MGALLGPTTVSAFSQNIKSLADVNPLAGWGVASDQA